MDSSPEYSRAVRRGVGFLLDSVRRQGSVIQDIDAFNKIPYALAVAGRRSEARALLRWIASTSPSDDFASRFLEKTHRPSLRAYYLAWLVLGAEASGIKSGKDQAHSRMLEYQSERFGGFYSEKRPDGEGVLHLVITSMCGYACVRVGRTDEARKAGDFLVRLLKAQPNPRKLYYGFDTKKGLLLTYPVNSAKKGQSYFVVGSGILFLCELWRATEEEKYIETAQTLFDFGLSCRSDILHSLPGGKFGWACSLLYRVRRDPRAKQVAEEIAHYLTRTQMKDGSWSVLGWPRLDETIRFWRSLKTTLAAEYVASLSRTSDNLA